MAHTMTHIYRPCICFISFSDVTCHIRTSDRRCYLLLADGSFAMWTSNGWCSQSTTKASWEMCRLRSLQALHILHWLVVVCRPRLMREGQDRKTVSDINKPWLIQLSGVPSTRPMCQSITNIVWIMSCVFGRWRLPKAKSLWLKVPIIGSSQCLLTDVHTPPLRSAHPWWWCLSLANVIYLKRTCLCRCFPTLASANVS